MWLLFALEKLEHRHDSIIIVTGLFAKSFRRRMLHNVVIHIPKWTQDQHDKQSGRERGIMRSRFKYILDLY